MNSTLMRHVKKILQNYRRKKTWQKVVTVMAAVVVFITTYMLILPAITMEADLVCGKEEHTHTEECYQTQPEQRELTCTKESLNIHKHTSDCYNANGVLICGYADYVVHTHDANCNDAEGNLVCTLPEVKEHTHTDGCYNANGELICDQPEVILHEHIAECYDEDGNLICGKVETKKHQHTEDCITVTSATETLVCGIEEHQHTEDCYGDEDENENSVSLFSDGNTLPVTELSGNETKYDPTTDLFTTKVRIDFQFNSDTGKPTANTTYTYTYPEGIIIPDDVVNKEVQNLYDVEKLAGTYQFIKNENGTYSVQVIFNNDYINGSGDTVTGYVQFEGSFDKDSMNDEGNIVVGADDATVLVPGDKITYPSDETESYNIDVSKSGSWVQDGDQLVYTVYVRTTKGTPDPIDFSDTITIPEGLSLGEPTVTIEKGTSYYYYHDWENSWEPTDQNDWSKVTAISSTYTNGKIEMSLNALSAGAGKDSNGSDCIIGDMYKITYTYPITDQTVVAVSLNNIVTVESKDTNKGQTVTDDAESTVNVTKDFSYTLDKSGAVASDKPGYIKWMVTVNSNKVDIAGAKLTDEMLGLVENVSGDIVIYPAEGATITKNEAGKITDITFSGISDNVNKNQYTITYYTPVEGSWNGTTVTNKAILDPKPDQTGDEKEASASVTVSGVKLNKQGTFKGATNQIEWTITVNAGNLDIAGAKLTDEMFSALTGSDLTIEPTTGCKINKNENDTIKDIEFEAVKDGKNTQTYTIKYFSAITENEDGSINSVTNTATLSPGEGKDGSPVGTKSTVTPENIQLTKSGSYDWNGKINWTITVNEGNRNIAGAILTDDVFGELTPADITIRDGNGQIVSSAEYIINKDENGQVTSIAFYPLELTAGSNTKKYVITYSTEALPEWEEKTVYNEAKFSINGKEILGNATVTVPADGSISKSVGEVNISEDGTTATISWTVTLTVPKGGLPAGTTIVDDVTKNQYGGTNTNQWMTRSQITAWATNLTWTDDNGNEVGGTNSYNPPPEQVTFLASDGNTYTYKQINEYTASAGEGEVNFDTLTYTLFTIHFPEGLIPPEGATKLTFTYSTTADLSNANMGQNKYYNDIKVGNKETSAEYTYYKPGVVKTDGNGNTDTTSVSNDGTLTWKVKATVGEGNKKLTLIDTLPDGVTLDSLMLTGWGNLNMDLTIENGVISGADSTNQYNVSGSITDNCIILNIEPQTENSSIQTGAEFTLAITCKVTNAENLTESKTLTNNVEMKLDGGQIGSSSQTQEWTYQETVDETKVVDKSGEWDNTNRIMNYTIILNKEGKELLSDSDTLTLVDVMSYQNTITFYHPFSGTYAINASLIQSSVKLYRAVWNKEKEEWEAGEPINDWSWTYEAKTGEKEWDKTNATNTITATGIPDGTPLMLQYAYRISSNVPDEVNGNKVSFDLQFTNKATLEGTGYSGDNSSSGTKWEYSSESAGVTTDKSYTFYKVEAGNYNVSLAGAEFSVYKYDTSSSGYEESPVKTYSTNDNGSFNITWQEKDSSGNVTFSYDTNTLYKVVETAPPKGYKLPDVVKTYYFYFSSSEDATHTLPAEIPADAVDLSNEAKTVYVENVKNSTEISVEKQWQDQNGAPITHNSGSVTVNLYQKNSQSSSSGGGNGEDANVTISVLKNEYNQIPACVQEKNKVCRKGTVFVFTVNTWGTPSLYANGKEVEVSSQSPGENGSTNFEYQLIISEDTEISGYAYNDNDGCVTYTYQEPSISTTPDESGNDSEDTYITEGILWQTITLSKDNDWMHTFTDLPLTGTDEDGNAVTYYYYVEEVSVPNYETSYDNNDGIQSGTITITNKATENPGVLLPETGGSGTIKYIMGGILLMLASVLLYIIQHIKEGRRKHIRR